MKVKMGLNMGKVFWGIFIKFIITTITIFILFWILNPPFYLYVILFFLFWLLLLCYNIKKVYELGTIVIFSYIFVLFMSYNFNVYTDLQNNIIFIPNFFSNDGSGLVRFIFWIFDLWLILLTYELVKRIGEKDIKLDVLFKSRIKDLNHIKSYIECKEYHMLGIDSEWGNGKSLVINHLINDKDIIKSYDFIKIDILSMNLDRLIDYLLEQIDNKFKKQGIYTLTSKYLISYFNNSQYGSFLSKFLSIDNSYSSLINDITRQFNQLNRGIIVIYEDIDRIDDLCLLKKIFYISERLANNSDSKIKFIYQYNSLELSKRGLDKLYLQKYIPYHIRLTHLSFEEIWDSIIESNHEKYKDLTQLKFKVLRIAENPFYITNDMDEFLRIIEIAEFKRENYTIRNIESFMNLLLLNITLINDNSLMLRLLYLKIFCSDFYCNISTFKDLNNNFVIEDNSEYILLSSLPIFMEANNEIGNYIISNQPNNFYYKFSYKTKRLNFQALLSYCILNIFKLKYIFKNTDDKNSIINEKFVEYKRFERELDYLIEVGYDLHDEYYKLADVLSKKLDNIKSCKEFELILNNIRWKGLPSGDNEAGRLISIGFGKWDICFIAFRDYSCSMDKYLYYQSKIIDFFFNCISEDDNLEDVFRVLNIFLNNSRLKFLQKQFIELLKHFLCMPIKSFEAGENYQLFKQYIYNAFVLFSYINRDNIHLDDFINLDSELSIDFINYLDNMVIKLHENRSNLQLDFSPYINSIDTIKEFIRKIIEINKNSYKSDFESFTNLSSDANLVRPFSQNYINNMLYSIRDIISILEKSKKR